MTSPDPLETEKALELMKQLKPSWQVNQQPPNPAADLFYRPQELRPARFDFGSVFNQDSTQDATGSPAPPEPPASTTEIIVTVFGGGSTELYYATATGLTLGGVVPP